jgi:hypothetical protein
VFAGDRLFAALLGRLNMKSQFRFSRIYNGTAESDVILVGNSRGHAFYQPFIRDVTGAATINLSYNALPVSVARALVEDYYDLYDAPTKIIIEVSLLNKSETNVINAFKVYRNKSERIKTVIDNNSPTTGTACMISNVYSYNTEVFHRSLYYLNQADADWILNRKINAGLIANAADIKPMEFEITDGRLNDLKVLIEKARAKKTQVELVIAPYYPAYLDKITNLQSFLSRIEKHTGLKVRDYSSLLTKDEFFSDYLHLNKAGSKEYINKLKEDGVL